MSITRAWMVFGADGHRFKGSFGNSSTYDFSKDGDPRIIQVLREDVTATNEYAFLVITRNTVEECYEEMRGQISDGVFENCRVGQRIDIPWLCC